MHNHDDDIDHDIEMTHLAMVVIDDTIGQDEADPRCGACHLRLLTAEVRHGRCGPCGQDAAVVAARRVIAASASAWRKEGLA